MKISTTELIDLLQSVPKLYGDKIIEDKNTSLEEANIINEYIRRQSSEKCVLWEIKYSIYILALKDGITIVKNNLNDEDLNFIYIGEHFVTSMNASADSLSHIKDYFATTCLDIDKYNIKINDPDGLLKIALIEEEQS